MTNTPEQPDMLTEAQQLEIEQLLRRVYQKTMQEMKKEIEGKDDAYVLPALSGLAAMIVHQYIDITGSRGAMYLQDIIATVNNNMKARKMN